MKFVINDDKLKIELTDTINSGSFRDYLMPVETDESWQGLSIEAIISKKDSNDGIARAVINNEVYIDMPKKERYTIGFIGYTIENNEKIYQKSTDLKILPIVKGAGEIEATNTEEVPTQSEWEVYLSLVQEFINNANTILSQAENVNIDSEKVGDTATITITNKNGETKTIQIKDGGGGSGGTSNHASLENLDYEHSGHTGFQPTINDLETIRSGANAGATAVQPEDLPDEVTESTVSEWGFTKNTGTYSKPVGGIPKDDLSNEVKSSLNKADSALQEHQSLAGLQSKITSNNKLSSDLIDDTNKTNKFVTIEEKTAWNNKSNFSGDYNDLSNKPTIPTVPTNVSAFTNDAGYLTQHQDISGKLDSSKVKSSSSTTAGDVYDVTYINTMLGDIETILTTLDTGSGV